jgi:membrane-bound metal-dependent hydrolase YbcI (DUF457 family)
MDIIAHSLSGVLLGQMAMKEDTARERLYYFGVGITALVLPDIDAISYLWGPDGFAAVHQRFTHTIIALGIFPLVMGSIIRKIERKHSFKRTYFLFLAGMMIHVAEDLIAHWPVEFFYPFSRKGWAFGLIQKDFSLVVDFLFIGGAMLSFYDKLARYRRWVAAGTFLVVLLYLLTGPGY